jgi:hypothetical protein
MTFDEGLEAIQSLRGWYSEHHANRNEATTRFHLIDGLFLDCLGWNKDEMVLEEEQDGEYSDYTFYLPRRALIVEAKREGVCFEVPAGTRLDMSIPALTRLEPSIGRPSSKRPATASDAVSLSVQWRTGIRLLRS